MPRQPLAEVFGFPIDNQSRDAGRYRANRLCPFNNKVPNCTKDRANDPLGVCSVFAGDAPTITCPVRFREDWLIAEDAASFFFAEGATWTSLVEVKLNDRNGKSAGNIDVVLVSYDDNGRILDFGSCEVQAVYISGNVRTPFEYYMEDPPNRGEMDWSTRALYPRPDFLSSSRKRLAPQLLFKGGILHSWRKKQAVAIDVKFFETLPAMAEVPREEAELAWFVYELQLEENDNIYELRRSRVVYTEFTPTMLGLTTADAGPVENFVQLLQTKLDQKLDLNPPDAPVLGEELLG